MVDKTEIHFTLDAWQMVMAAVNYRKDKEVAGFGRCRFDGERFIVDDIIIPPQEVGGAHADFDIAAGDMDWLGQIMADGGQPEDWKLWWHSHASMATSPSSTDHTTLKALARQFGGYAVGTVVNNKQEATGWMAAQVEYVSPLTRQTMTQPLEEELKVTCETYSNPELLARVLEQMKAVVEPPVKTQQPTVIGTGAQASLPKTSFWKENGGRAQAQLPFGNKVYTPDKRGKFPSFVNPATHRRLMLADMNDKQFHDYCLSDEYREEREAWRKDSVGAAVTSLADLYDGEWM